jgi:uncharacterized membrane protein
VSAARRPGVDRRLFGLVEHLRTSLWALPAALAAAAVVAARLSVLLDGGRPFENTVLDGWLYSGSVESARTILSTLAGSMITVAGLVFSITIVALSFSSTQLGPRLLRNFRDDRVNQAVLGSFVATFLYALLVLSSLATEPEVFVPRFAVTCSLLLGTLSFFVLIYYMHRVATLMQADSTVRGVRAQLERQIEELYPRELGQEGRAAAPDAASHPHVLRAARSGYLQAVDHAFLSEVAEDEGCELACTRLAGEFVLRGDELLRSTRAPADRDSPRACEGLVLGAERTDAQDVGYAIRQLVEVALRALSPGINDPNTAAACVDQLGAALESLGGRPTPAWTRPAPRVVARALDLPSALDAALRPIAEHGARQRGIALRLLDVLRGLAAQADDEARRDAVAQLADEVLRTFEDGDPLERAREEVTAARERVEAALRAAGGS